VNKQIHQKQMKYETELKLKIIAKPETLCVSYFKGVIILMLRSALEIIQL
jgi:hypothetical protein